MPSSGPDSSLEKMHDISAFLQKVLSVQTLCLYVCHCFFETRVIDLRKIWIKNRNVKKWTIGIFWNFSEDSSEWSLVQQYTHENKVGNINIAIFGWIDALTQKYKKKIRQSSNKNIVK